MDDVVEFHLFHFTFFNVANRKFQILYVAHGAAHITCLLGSAGLELHQMLCVPQNHLNLT